MGTVRVTFLPNQESVETQPGKTLLEVAKQAGIFVASICGGDGICGKCRLIVQSGEVDASPTTLLSRQEIQAGYVLACQTKVVGDVEVLVPPESRGEGAQILIDQDAQRFRALYPTTAEQAFYRHDPLVQKLLLDLPEPNLQDNLGCRERLYREIRRHIDAPVMQMGLKVLQALPSLHRDKDWKVTATLGRRGGTLEVIQVEAGDHAGRNYGIALDVGTSTVVIHLLDLTTSETIDAEACYNSQAPFGAEVTRVAIVLIEDAVSRCGIHVVKTDQVEAVLGEPIGQTLRDLFRRETCLAGQVRSPEPTAAAVVEGQMALAHDNRPMLASGRAEKESDVSNRVLW